jgi:hypothetical protein
MKQPRAINITSTDKRIYRVIWDDVPMFYNSESSEWDAIPAFFYGLIWIENEKHTGFSQDAYLLQSHDVDSVQVIW